MKTQIGGTRIVFILKNYVVKVPLPITFKTFIIGAASNYREKFLYENYKHTNTTIKLAKVKMCLFGLLLVQERCRVDEAAFNSISMSDFYRYSNMFVIDVKEFNAKNIGVDANGRITAMDYGFTLPTHDRGTIYLMIKKLRTKINRL